jgi:hypothetical protein
MVSTSRSCVYGFAAQKDTQAHTDMKRYADYQIYPEEPTVGMEKYPPNIYNSWDPNWRGFVGTTLVVMLEEFAHLIPQDVQNYMMESLYNTTIGDSYRVGGVDDDNLYPAYSNPSIMRAFVSGWVGRRANDSNMTTAGEDYANEIIDLFERDNTLSEFNSGTYAGVSLFALTLWAKYMPQDSLMGQHGPEMIRRTWTSLGELYNANLKNVAGPWDRSYGFDMNRYLSILALQMWTLVGKDKAPVYSKVSHETYYFRSIALTSSPAISNGAQERLRHLPFNRYPRSISQHARPTRHALRSTHISQYPHRPHISLLSTLRYLSPQHHSLALA